MTVEVRPLGVSCNLSCSYCYQEPQRLAGNHSNGYDMNAMKEALEQENQRFSLFGGEALLMRFDDLKELVEWGTLKFGRVGIQTNATLLTEKHINLFKANKVSVGISIDGTAGLNSLRKMGGRNGTSRATMATENAIKELLLAGITPSFIITLHRQNAATGQLPALKEWIADQYKLGIRSIRLHLLEVDSPEVRQLWTLTETDNIAALRSILELKDQCPEIKFDLFEDMENMLQGKDLSVGCVWRGCDPFTTSAVSGVEGDGQRSNCGRTNKDGIDFVKSEGASYERYIALYNTPQEYGGCKDCRFFLMCKGECPGEGLDGDWRNRSEHCGVWKSIYSDIEAKLVSSGVVPLSLKKERGAIENAMLTGWSRGENTTLVELLEQYAVGKPDKNGNVPKPRRPVPPIGPEHGDYKDAPHNDGHRDTPGHSDDGWLGDDA